MVSVKAIGPLHTLAEDSAGNIFALNQTALAEFSPTGMLQSQPATAAIAVASHSGPTIFQADGRYIVAEGVVGLTRRDTDVQLVRFTSTGAVDTTFNNPKFDFGGVDTVDTDFAQALALQINSQIVVGGGHTVAGSTVFGMAWVNPDGSMDTTFGPGGVLTTKFSGADQVMAVLVQTDGKIVAVGQTFNGSTDLASLALARYLGD